MKKASSSWRWRNLQQKWSWKANMSCVTLCIHVYPFLSRWLIFPSSNVHNSSSTTCTSHWEQRGRGGRGYFSSRQKVVYFFYPLPFPIINTIFSAPQSQGNDLADSHLWVVHNIQANLPQEPINDDDDDDDEDSESFLASGEDKDDSTSEDDLLGVDNKMLGRILADEAGSGHFHA